jgi:hypothetical protein
LPEVRAARIVWSCGPSPTACPPPWLIALARPRPEAATHACCPVVELRQYTLKPGQRDTLIGIFGSTSSSRRKRWACGWSAPSATRVARPLRVLRGFSDWVARAGLGVLHGPV